MGLTIGEKILAKACGRETVEPGEIITANIDLCMTNDATTHISIDIFQNQLKDKVIFDSNKVVFVIDHNVPSESVESSGVHKKMRQFARKHELNFYEGEGICHQIMLEDFVTPGQLIIAADSHTCSYGGLGAFGTGVGSTDFTYAMSTGEIWLKVPETLKFNLNGNFNKDVYARDLILKIIGDIGANGANYKIMEFGGDGIKHLTIGDRVALSNMTVEAGAKTGIVEPDEKTIEYVKGKGRNRMDVFGSDKDAQYKKVFDYNLNELEPMVAKPHSVDNVVLVSEVKNKPIDQGFIGSCNNGRIENLRVAANILKKSEIDSDVKLLISPASNQVYTQAIEEGLIEIFLESGAQVLNPNCSVCWGGAQGVIGKGETLISTGTRNFKGRAGHSESEIFLGSAATVAASAVMGKITDPRRI